MAKNVATEFDKIINDARERKKNEALATKIFSKTRRQSAPSQLKATPGASLASRIGTKKRASIGGAKTPSNVNGEWTHDLHSSVNDARSKGKKTTALGSRITKPGQASSSAPAAAPTGPAGKKKAAAAAARKAAALERMDIDPVVKGQVTVHKAPPPTAPRGMSIRGLAGPFAVLAQNFAPGTSEADIESAMTPIGGEMQSCRIVKTSPFIMVEMVFLSREGGERVIETFNNKTADGRILKVFPKIGGNTSSSSRQTHQTARNVADSQFVDGSMGFPEPVKQQELYSDRMVNNNNDTGNSSGGGAKRGRGTQRGRGGR